MKQKPSDRQDPVILHEECVAIQMQVVGKVLHHFGECVEGVSEFLRARPRRMTEPGVIWRDEMIVFAEAGFEQRLIHPRGRW